MGMYSWFGKSRTRNDSIWALFLAFLILCLLVTFLDGVEVLGVSTVGRCRL